ncbi:hypothetical protein GCK72_023533 [Caenorhabditis remanei]|uniref:Uncharacterized protein n=1 Tax=Caenorhabditis remanei TaxID=31234 RepID=A0A6A5FX70_CAERE|nr:hypothetical protein GCK72_023533 [Caenorhabditis remanei]KAF1747074.1 hypothetical protein GCK72_023533 [Caenorhabditis remanei]
MNFKLFVVLFLAASLLVSMSEAGKDRRKKQKQKDRAEDDEADEETAGGKGLENSGKGKDEKERTSVLEKQAEKKTDDDESSSEEDDEEDGKKDNSTVIIRKRREAAVILPTDAIEVQRKIRSMIQSYRAISADEGRILPTDNNKFKRDTQIQKSREINDGVQLPLDKKPSATASTSN